ncbi:hypothetical protein ACIQFU_04365 [Streptomyces sp. NPDC093065]|uniref:hypothetical protein n=1 Tax=Streptomyces sp. NPDC093065 TaxID=3366021 RepID=UPI003811DF0A
MSSMSQARPPAPTAVSMRDLLASCAAAAAVSTPPRAPEPETRRPARDQDGPDHRDGRDHREAA